MFRASVVAGALLFVVAITASTQAQTPTPATVRAHKAETIKERWANVLAKWRHNRPKLKACQAEARRKGLAGDDRWFFLGSCMDKHH
jgi:hypothetical protein